MTIGITDRMSLHKKANVNFVGMGKGEIIVGVETKLPLSDLAKKDVIPSMVAGYKTDVIETGEITALITPPEERIKEWRPAPGGVSIGHYKITAGTLGTLVWCESTEEFLILSNNHVMANCNNAYVGDPIYQPGPHDGGTQSNLIAKLLDWEPIVFHEEDSGCLFSRGFAWFWTKVWRMAGRKTWFRAVDSDIYWNLVDCALAHPESQDFVKNEIFDIGVPQWVDDPVVTVGMKVKKSGRTTALNEGEVLAVDGSAVVGYGGDLKAYFMDQILTGPMASGGDSGSLLCNEENNPVGLLFAGSNQVTIHNRIQNVRDAMEV